MKKLATFFGIGWSISGGWLISELAERHPEKSKKLKWTATFFAGPVVWCVAIYVETKKVLVKHNIIKNEVDDFYEALIRAGEEAEETIRQFRIDMEEELNGGR